MQNLIREHRMNVAHMNALVSGRAIHTEDDELLGADKQGAFVGEGTPHDAASKAGCSASGYSGTREEVGVAGSIPARSTKRFTYSIVTDDRQTGWYDPGTGVRNDQTGLLMNDEPMSARRAERLLEELENPEVEL